MESVVSTLDCSSPSLHLFARAAKSPSPKPQRRSTADKKEKESAEKDKEQGTEENRNGDVKEKEKEGENEKEKEGENEKEKEGEEDAPVQGRPRSGTKGRAPSSQDKETNEETVDDTSDHLSREELEKEKRAAFKRSLMEVAKEDAPFPGIKLYVVDAEQEKKMSPEEKDKNELKYISEMEKKDKASGVDHKAQTGLGMELHASFAEDWAAKAERIRQSSPYKDLPNWGKFFYHLPHNPPHVLISLPQFSVEVDDCKIR